MKVTEKTSTRGCLQVASRYSGDRDFEMSMGSVEKRSGSCEADEQSVGVAGLAIKFADFAGRVLPAGALC